MSDAVPGVLSDVFAYLDGLAREGARPETACARLPQLRARHPGAEIEVVWEEQAFDRSMHYDALIRPPGGATISMSVCPDSELPWPLRGLQRWKDSDLVRVNTTVMSVADAIAKIDVLWEKAPLMQRVIDSCLIEEALAREPFDVDDEEVQQALDGMRRGRGLYTVADFEAWMADTGTTWQALETLAIALARTARLRERTVGDRVDAYLAQHRSEFDLVALASVQTRSAQVAAALAEAVRLGGQGLLQAAQQAFAQSPEQQIETSLRQVRRHQLDAPVARAMAEAQIAPGPSGSIAGGVAVGPLATEDGFTLVQPLSVEPALPGEALRRAVVTKLFDDWLREQRRSARIEWFWGDVERTARQQGPAASAM
jgi:putative peptide maturation system protein